MNKRVPPRCPTEESHYGLLEKTTGQRINKRHIEHPPDPYGFMQ